MLDLFNSFLFQLSKKMLAERFKSLLIRDIYLGLSIYENKKCFSLLQSTFAKICWLILIHFLDWDHSISASFERSKMLLNFTLKDFIFFWRSILRDQKCFSLFRKIYWDDSAILAGNFIKFWTASAMFNVRMRWVVRRKINYFLRRASIFELEWQWFYRIKLEWQEVSLLCNALFGDDSL